MWTDFENDLGIFDSNDFFNEIDQIFDFHIFWLLLFYKFSLFLESN